jgi:hypothetical protein
MNSPNQLKGSVVTRIEGGLGNQLFQYAAAIALADRLGCDLALDLRALSKNGDRQFQLGLYKSRFRILAAGELALLPESRVSRWRRISADAKRFFLGRHSLQTFWARGFEFDPRFESISVPVYLVGYWQSEFYFQSHRARLLSDLQLVNPKELVHPLQTRLSSCNSIALHIRRGDYVSNGAASQFHGVCDIAYYHSAIEFICRHTSSPEAFVFSDDIDWARVNLKLTIPMHFVEGHSAEAGHLDLELMRRCKHHVVANSSFSWWGAWLAQSENQIVCAPKRWFAASEVNSEDVVPQRWVRL